MENKKTGIHEVENIEIDDLIIDDFLFATHAVEKAKKG